MSSPTRIVVAEDEDADVMLLRHALAKSGVNAEVTFTRDGQETIDFLQGHQDVSVLLLLDLRMPRVDGFEVLRWLRDHDVSARVSIVVLSSSGETEDIRRAGELGANAYIVKPDDPFELCRVMERVQQFWEAGRPPEPATIGGTGS